MVPLSSPPVLIITVEETVADKTKEQLMKHLIDVIPVEEYE